ncbi:MAG: BolA family transcriptional regulator [Rhodospirillales bacterium]|nr:BolA family transcriptional regulator [Rhodospirillales bacterium]
MNGRAERMEGLLRAAFAPSALAIEDQSARHAHHAGVRTGGAHAAGETHYRIAMVAAAFEGRSRVDRQRAVHAALADEFAGGLHALSLVLRSPEEAGAEDRSP